MLEFLRHAKNAEKAGKDFVQKEKISNDKFGGRSTALQKANLPLYLSIISIIYIYFFGVSKPNYNKGKLYSNQASP